MMVYVILAALCYQHGMVGWCITASVCGVLRLIAEIVKSLIDN